MLKHIDHRPWPPPNSPWKMAQTWSDLLFMHWPLSPDVLRPVIPASLEIDTFEGQTWIGVVPFRMSEVHPRLLPSVPWLSAFPELNVRVYVRAEDKPGVYFFSLEAGNPLAVLLARQFFHLPYFRAAMTCQRIDDWVQYRSARHIDSAAQFVGRYRPIGAPFTAPIGSLEDWLTARYCLYTTNARGDLFRGEIHHAPWPLQHAEAIIEKNTMTLPIKIALPDVPPLLHFSHRLEVVVWLLNRVNRS